MSVQKLSPVTDEQWAQVPSQNRKLYDDYFLDNVELSSRTVETYRSNLKIWFWWLHQNYGDKLHTDVKSRDYKRFQNWLVDRGCSSSDIKTKRSTISSLNNYIMVYYEDEYPTFRNFINASIKVPENAFVNEKNPPTKEELDKMIEDLESSDLWDKYQKIAYLKFTFTTGCRRAETRQLLKSDVIGNEPIVKTITVTDEDGNKVQREAKYYLTHEIRCKGRGKTGKVRRLKFDEETYQALLKWLEQRDDDCEYVFVTRDGDRVRQVSLSTFNQWGSGIFTKLLGRRFHPHCLREARATDIVVAQGKPIEVAQSILSHKSAETTKLYVIRDTEDEDDDELFI